MVDNSERIQSSITLAHHTIRHTDHGYHNGLEDIRTRASIPNSALPNYQSYELRGLSRFQCVRNIVTKFWLWEVVGCITSLACMISIVTVLLYENGKELDRWGLFILPNAVVSFIATLAKAPLVLVVSQIISQLKWHHYQEPKSLLHLRLFDDASRCPVGSSRLFFASKSKLASAAAVLMVCTLLVDPFVQLVFVFPSEPVVDYSKASSFSRAKTYGPGHHSNHSMGRSGRQGSWGQYTLSSDLTRELVNSISDGLTTKDDTMSITCPSGNCTWSNPISSLGVCSSCRDMTTSVTTTCLSAGSDFGFNSTPIIYHNDSKIVLTCNHQFPHPGPILSNSVLQSNHKKSRAELFSILWNSTAYFHDLYDTAGHDTNRPYIASVFAIQAKATTAYDYTLHPPPTQAWQCNLQWCEKTYEDIAVNNAIPSVANVVEQPLVFTNTTKDDFFLLNLENHDSTATQNHPYLLHKGLFNESEHLRDMLTFTYMERGNWPQYAKGPKIQGDISMGDVLANSVDLDATFRSLAAHLTEIVRTGQNSTAIPGNSIVWKAVIRVRWAWLALPLTLLALTSTLLAIVAIRSHVKDIPVWKQDPLALLFLKLEDIDPTIPHGRVSDLQDLSAISREQSIRLSPEKPFKFVRTTT